MRQPSTRTTPLSPILVSQSAPVPSAPLLLTHQAGVTTGIVAHAQAGLAGRGTNNTYPAAPQTYEAGPASHNPSNNWWPQDNPGTGYQIQADTYHTDATPWASIPQQSNSEQQQADLIYTQALPPRSRNPHTPTISLVTPDFPNFGGLQQHQQPQDTYHSATSASSVSSLHGTQQQYDYNPYTADLLSPQNSRLMASDQREMQTPPRSPHAQAIGEPVARKRSHSIMSEGAAAQLQNAGSRSGSVASPQPHSGDEYSPNSGSRTFKRSDAPPMNSDHKYICIVSPECDTLVFDRKCEWR